MEAKGKRGLKFRIPREPNIHSGPLASGMPTMCPSILNTWHNPRTSGACGLDILSSVDGWWGDLKSEACPTFSVVYSFLNIRLYTKHTLSKRWLVGC